MWKFFEKVYAGEFGGCGLLIAFIVLCSTLATIIQALCGKG
jgi:hypothetical protein